MKEPLRRTKVVIRHLPSSLTQSSFFSQIDDRFSDRYNWFSFRLGKSTHKHQRYSRAYINFKRPEDVFDFAEFFGGHVLLTRRVVYDPDYLEFLKIIAKPVENLPSAEVQLERKEAELSGAPKGVPVITPLMEFVRQRRAAECGAQGSITLRKSGKKAAAASRGKPGSSSKRGSEKKKYILKDGAKGAKKSYSLVASKKEDHCCITVCGIDGPVTGINFCADSGKQKILLLKPKDRKAPQASEGEPELQGAPSPVATSSGSTALRQRQRQEDGGKLIRGILLSNESSQNRSSAVVQPQQKNETMSLDNVKRPPRPTNARLGFGSEKHENVQEIRIDLIVVYGPLFFVLKFHKLVRSTQHPPCHNLPSPLVFPVKLIYLTSAYELLFIQGEMKGGIPNGSSGRNIPSENGSSRDFARHTTTHNAKDDGFVILKDGKSFKEELLAHSMRNKFGFRSHLQGLRKSN
ncbi:Smg-4/UPF3 family protein, putative isoform 6 [Hibiscus syriacus]|uniref:Smg-4/UPF3 family protein, putative isoform 6 n=1 Tax=Hibiscus syriacus TaxID=106335 RepID=A0A6A2ZYH2_HIBSY|nr:Smg-4/UPF3 family protein, putative isoform 6 [Hibiscus syriacus]